MATPRSGTSRWNRILKNTLNRVTLRAARSGHGPFSIVASVGRKTGRHYETPIIVQPTDGGFMIELTYGDQVQWYKNVRAAGNCRIRYRGREFTVTGFEAVDAAAGLAAFSPAQRRILTLLRRDHFIRFLTD